MLSQYIKRILLTLIKLYQRTLSLDHGPLKFLRPAGACKFYPTCSAYAYESINRYGALKGTLKGLKRLLRCHPWSAGGYEPVATISNLKIQIPSKFKSHKINEIRY